MIPEIELDIRKLTKLNIIKYYDHTTKSYNIIVIVIYPFHFFPCSFCSIHGQNNEIHLFPVSIVCFDDDVRPKYTFFTP